MRFVLCTLLCLLIAGARAGTTAVRPAPEFGFLGAGERAQPLKSLRGQPVVVLIADSVRNKALRAQLKNLQEVYSELAGKGAILVAALAKSGDPIPTNLPVALATDGQAVAAAYGVSKGFAIAIVGRDGNLDYQTTKVITAQRVREVIQNSADVQVGARKGQ